MGVRSLLCRLNTTNIQPFDTIFWHHLLTVLFEVELLSYIDHKAADDYDAFTEVSVKLINNR